jgi:hypothetical protein
MGSGRMNIHLSKGMMIMDGMVTVHNAVREQYMKRGQELLNDSICSDEEFLEAQMLGEWVEGEVEGVVTTLSKYNGNIYILDQKLSRGVRRF